jgi:c(7)-type cytochrome triheme protein
MKKITVYVFLGCLLSGSAAWGVVGGGEIVFIPTGAGNVVYSHETHVTKVGLKCTECHYKIFINRQSHKKATMADMQQGQSCGACHNGTRAFDVKGNCNKCHM